MAALGSGCSFGFFMGIGMVMRTEMESSATDDAKQYQVAMISADGIMREHILYLKYEI